MKNFVLPAYLLLAALFLAGQPGSTRPLPPATQPSQQLPLKGTSIDVDINGVLSVLDSRTSTLRQYAPDGRFLREIGGQGWGNDQFDRPSGLWARNGLDFFVADYGNHRIQRFDKNLAFVSSFSTRESDNPDERFGYPTDVAISRLGEMYICDSENARIVKVGTSSRVERTFGGYGAGQGRLYRPMAVKCGPEDQVYVLDPPRVMVFDNFGNTLGELLQGGFTHPAAIVADERHLAVLDVSQVIIFGPGHRREAVIPLPRADLGENEVMSCALAKDSLYVLGPAGLSVWPIPQAGDR